jgi:hypothetical protein
MRFYHLKAVNVSPSYFSKMKPKARRETFVPLGLTLTLQKILQGSPSGQIEPLSVFLKRLLIILYLKLKSMKKKECPSCAMEIDSESKVCPVCEYEFPTQSKIKPWIIIGLLILFLTVTLIGWFRRIF